MEIRHRRGLGVLAGWLLAGALVSSATAQELALKRVVLSTGGVGYFEHEAEIDGDAELAFDVRLDQVDDVLKSVVVLDDRGGVGTISLPGRRPLAQIFRDLPFGADALESPVALLNALQGAAIRAAGARTLEGRLLRVEPETTVLPDGGGTVTRHRVSVITPRGLEQFVLEEADSLRFADPGLEAQVEGALEAVADHRAHDVRTLTVAMKGAGTRRAHVAYVVEAPLWKTSYRLVLPAGDAADAGLLQGWAVVENMSGGDWENVALTLVSGNPVTFRQAIYTAYYVDRPEVPVEVLSRVLPRPDRGALRAAQMAAGELEKGRARAEAFDTMGGYALMAEAAPAEYVARASDIAQALAAESDEAATQVVFRVPYPVSVESGHSLVVPIVNGEVPLRRLSHYQPDTHASHPLAAVSLVNESGSGLPPGVLTLYERSAGTGALSYIGDARLATLPAGDKRLVSFAVDQKTRIGRDVESTHLVAGGSISRGVFRLTRRERQTTVYHLKAPAHEARTIVLDHLRQVGWTLVEPDESRAALTQDHYRIEVAIRPGEERSLPVTLERPVESEIGIASMSLGDFVRFAATGALEPALREAFERLAELKRAVDQPNRRIGELENERKVIHQEQTRIRENLATVPPDSDLFRRYLKKLDVQEDRLEDIGAALAAALRERGEAEARLLAFIDTLKI